MSKLLRTYRGTLRRLFWLGAVIVIALLAASGGDEDRGPNDFYVGDLFLTLIPVAIIVFVGYELIVWFGRQRRNRRD